ncbi:MAG TPA: hypothetical protein PKV55_11595, partial [Nitrospira sp.]|nr:hypothetical protein [Nitrospira sp.]
ERPFVALCLRGDLNDRCRLGRRPAPAPSRTYSALTFQGRVTERSSRLVHFTADRTSAFAAIEGAFGIGQQ